MLQPSHETTEPRAKRAHGQGTGEAKGRYVQKVIADLVDNDGRQQRHYRSGTGETVQNTDPQGRMRVSAVRLCCPMIHMYAVHMVMRMLNLTVAVDMEVQPAPSITQAHDAETNEQRTDTDFEAAFPKSGHLPVQCHQQQAERHQG
jgi:hypothetical protein